MSTKREAYCTLQDLQDVVPEVDTFDRKRLLGGWVETATSDLYVCHDSGVVAQLYRDGEDLGAAQVSAVACDTDGYWFYDSSADACYLFSTLDPTTSHRTEGGDEWSDVYTRAIARATAMLRSFVRRPILKRPASSQDVGLRDYDECIIQATATLACAYLAGEENAGLRDRLMEQVFGTNPDMRGLALQIRDGEFRLWNEAGPETRSGEVSEISLDASTTGGIAEIRGKASVSYDVAKVVIVTGGTFTEGSTSTVTYSVYVAGALGVKTNQVVTASIINGTFQQLAYGLELMFAPGVYVADDEWEVRINGMASETERHTAPVARF